jgi:hypothetical protein
MHEGDFREHMAGARTKVAMEVPTLLGPVWGAGGESRIPPFAAGGKAKAADEFAQHFCGGIVAASYESAEPIAAEGECDVVGVHG